MAYSNANVDYVCLSPNYSKGRKCINRITIHHMAGNLSVERCGQVSCHMMNCDSVYALATF